MRYTSSSRLLNMPLVDIQLFEPGASSRVVRGWIAVGDIAIGYLLAIGGVATGGIALGGLSLGVLSIGGLALGGICMGGGALAALWAVGGLAIASHAAVGGLAIALSYAQGGLALAAHANDSIAVQYLTSHPFFSIARAIALHSRWALLLVFLPLIPLVMNRRRGA